MSYTEDEIKEFSKKLKELPAIKKQKNITKMEAVKFLKNDIIELRKRGYSVENISESMNGIGLDISIGTLKSYLARAKMVTKPAAKKKAQSQATVDTPRPAPADKVIEKDTSGFKVREDTIDI